MNTFINTKKDFSPNTNFWQLNPHLIYVKPFADLYEEDKTRSKEQSSKDMWCILWMSDPDEETNRYYRLPIADRIDTCKNFNAKFDSENELIQVCIKAYVDVCLTTIERALKAEKDALMKRGLFLQQAEYDYGTMQALDNAFSKTSKILEQYEKAYQAFVESKKKQITLYGGREQTAREQKRITTSAAIAAEIE